MSDSGNGTPAGWYPDGQGGQRWWDGAQWGPVGQPPASPPPASPPYGSPGGYPGGPAPARSRTALYAVIAVIAVAVIAFAVTAFAAPGFLLSDDSSSSSSDGASGSDPVDTVNAFLDASKNQDCDAVRKLVSAKLLQQLEETGCGDTSQAEDLGINPDDFTYDVGDAQIDGDTASVPVTISGESLGPIGEVSLTYLLVKEDGTWLIDDFKTELPDVPTGAPSVDIPTLDPSDLPTDLPSDLLSDFPSDLLSDFPSDFMSDFPSDFPTG